MKAFYLCCGLVLMLPSAGISQQIQTGISQQVFNAGSQVNAQNLNVSAEKYNLTISKHPERSQLLNDGISGVFLKHDTHIGARPINDSFATVMRIDPNSRAQGKIFEGDLVLAMDDVPFNQRSTRDGFKRQPTGTWHKYTISRSGRIFDVEFQTMPLFEADEFFQDFYAQGQLNPAFSPFFVQDKPGAQPRFGGLVDPYGNHK